MRLSRSVPESLNSPEAAIRFLIGHPRFGNGLGLHRMHAMMATLQPARWLSGGRVIHVTGSQGKGTVATLTAAILEQMGYKVGLMVSPHLMAFEERIVIAGRSIEADLLLEATKHFAQSERDYLAQHPEDVFGSFEAVTACAFAAFGQADIDVAVLEAGIGGRFDATRIAGGRLVALTSIDLEHAALLGPSEEHILYDKVDLCPRGGQLIAGSLNAKLRARLQTYAQLQGIGLIQAQDQISIANIVYDPSGATVDLSVSGHRLRKLRTRLFGEAQLRNAGIAILLARAWLEQTGHHLESQIGDAVRSALGRTAPQLRFESIDEEPLTIADVAHTPQAAIALVETLAAVYPGKRFVFLVGIARDKPAPAILAPLIERACAFVFTQSHRGIVAEALANSAAAAQVPLYTESTMTEAYPLARHLAREQNVALVITGSVFIAAEAKCVAAGSDPAALQFLKP